MVTAFLDDLAQKLNSGEEYDPDEPFELEFVHVQAGRTSGEQCPQEPTTRARFVRSISVEQKTKPSSRYHGTTLDYVVCVPLSPLVACTWPVHKWTKTSRNHDGHRCSEGKGIHCPGCQQNECHDYIEAYLRKRHAHIPCRHCRRQFYRDACFQLHQTKILSGKACGPNQSSVCESWHKCANCRKLLRSMNEEDKHRCGYSECPSCHETTDLNQHQCFVQVPTDPEELEDRACILQINKRTRLRREARSDPNTAMEGQEEEDNTYHPQLLVFWDTGAIQNTGVHVPNLVVGMAAEDASLQIFRGENCIEEFLQWLEELTKQETRHSSCPQFQGL